MAMRSYADVAPTAATMALNAYIFGYGGHSLVTPHVALKQLWWTDERIEAKVTRPFIISRLRAVERIFLDKPVAFGDGLTDDTYMEWILERAKRLFLILVEIGVPDQIFGCIDDSWDDDDLPVSLENVRRLGLAYENDEVLNKRFYDAQFLYLLRELGKGGHIDYGPKEHIPMEHVNTLPPAVCLQPWHRVHFPGRPDAIFMRRKFHLKEKETGQEQYASFMKDIGQAQTLRHEHIANVWGSYTSDNAAYILSDFVGEHTLGTFIDHRTPAQFLRVPRSERPGLLCEWMHCLADALASLHHRGVAHTAIRPSNILIDRSNRIAFADVGSIRTFQKGKIGKKTEIYDYAAPESWVCKSLGVVASSPPLSSRLPFNKSRKPSSSTHSSDSTSTSGSGMREAHFHAPIDSPILYASRDQANNIIATSTSGPTSSILDLSSSDAGEFGHHPHHTSSPSCAFPAVPPPIPSSMASDALPTEPTLPASDTPPDPSDAPSATSDIFSLACIFLDILTFLLQGKLTAFVKFRRRRRLPPPASSFHHRTPAQLAAWLDVLAAEVGARRADPLAPVVLPALLALVRAMLAPDPRARPRARAVRDRLEHILLRTPGGRALCCAGREWDSVSPLPPSPPPPPLVPGGEAGRRLSATASVSDGSGVDARSTRPGERARSKGAAGAAMARLGGWRRAFVREPAA